MSFKTYPIELAHLLLAAAPAWLFELMQLVVKRYGLDPSLVKMSALSEAPSFPA